MLQSLLTLDGNILLYIQEHMRNPYLTAFFAGITRLGDGGVFWIALTLSLLVFARTRKAGFVTAVALIFSTLIAILFLKNIINRARPYDVIEGLVLIGSRQTDASFPSGHTSTAFTCVAALWKYLKKPYVVLLLVLATVIALSRLYIGVHYPSDVLAGLLIGISCGLGGRKLGELLWEKMETYRQKKQGHPVDDSGHLL